MDKFIDIIDFNTNNVRNKRRNRRSTVDIVGADTASLMSQRVKKGVEEETKGSETLDAVQKFIDSIYDKAKESSEIDAEETETYVVRPGDTISDIIERKETSLALLELLNEDNPSFTDDVLTPGDAIKVIRRSTRTD